MAEKRNPSVKKTFLTHIHTQHRNYSKMAQTWQQKENDGGKVMPQKSVKHHGNGGTHLQTDARHTAWRASNAKARSEGELSACSQWDKGIVTLVEPNSQQKGESSTCIRASLWMNHQNISDVADASAPKRISWSSWWRPQRRRRGMGCLLCN